MDKFELEAYRRASSKSVPDDAADSEVSHAERDAAAAIAALSPSVLDALEPVEPKATSRSSSTDEAPSSTSDAASGQVATTGSTDPDALRTKLARKFVALADSVNESFQEFAIGAGAWAVELTAPQGMSTGGGKQSLQHLRLRPRRTGYSAFVAGTVDQGDKRAELRDYDHVAIMHEVRFRRSLDISRAEWEQFLRKAEVVLNGAGIQSLRTPPPRDLLEQRRHMTRVSKRAVAVLVVVLVLAAVVTWRVVVALTAG